MIKCYLSINNLAKKNASHFAQLGLKSVSLLIKVMRISI